VAAGLFFLVRGTWASDRAEDPGTVAQGPVAQIYQPAGGPKQVRCAVLLPYPPARVWQVVSDYERYPSFVPYLAEVKVEKLPDGCRLAGQARSLLVGYWPFAIRLHESRRTDCSVASWDEKGEGGVLETFGSWEVRPAGRGQTLLVLSLEARVRRYPDFLLRNVFLHRLKVVLRDVARHLEASEAGP
jgi:hypothetical protein